MDRPTRLALAGWCALVAVGIGWGSTAVGDGDLGLGAAPLAGRWDWHPSPGLAVAAALGALVVWQGPLLAQRLRWVAVPVVTAVSATAWATALAASDGWTRVVEPLTNRHEYEPFAASITSPGRFVATYLERQPDLPVHVKGHPPGATLVPWTLDAVGVGGPGWFAALALVGWGVAAGAALVAARAVAGEDTARRAAPALVLLPAAVWAGTSADALFAGVVAVGVAVAVRGRHRHAASGGVILGGGLFLTYGATVLLAIPGLVHLRRRRFVHAGLVVAGAVAVLLGVWVLTGFSWFDGLEGTRRAYWSGIASHRPASYVATVGNPAALAIALGPAAAVGLVAAARHWRDLPARLPVAALVCVALANASLLSKGEVERIWLPFVPWLALAAPGASRRWLAVQAGGALLLQSALVSRW